MFENIYIFILVYQSESNKISEELENLHQKIKRLIRCKKKSIILYFISFMCEASSRDLIVRIDLIELILIVGIVINMIIMKVVTVVYLMNGLTLIRLELIGPCHMVALL